MPKHNFLTFPHPIRALIALDGLQLGALRLLTSSPELQQAALAMIRTQLKHPTPRPPYYPPQVLERFIPLLRGAAIMLEQSLGVEHEEIVPEPVTVPDVKPSKDEDPEPEDGEDDDEGTPTVH